MSIMLGTTSVRDLHGPWADFMDKLQGENGSYWFTEFKKFLRKEPTWQGATPAMDTHVRILRPDRAIYPNWVKRLKYPALESVGPGEYDLARLEHWLHPEQRSKPIPGTVVYAELKKYDLLKGCLGLRDGYEIVQKGVTVFRSLFKDAGVFLWKSVVVNHNGDLFVPFLTVGVPGKECVALLWYSMTSNLDHTDIALRWPDTWEDRQPRIK